MFRVAVNSRRAMATATAAAAAVRNAGIRYSLPRPPRFSSPASGFCSNNSNSDPVALQMIDYALTLSRSPKPDVACSEALLVLEQCLSNYSNGDSAGRVLLAMATLLFERGKLDEAIERLQGVQQVPHSSIPVKFNALEASVGLHLELEQDDSSSRLADKCLQLSREIGCAASGKFLHYRAKAVKGLVELVNGNLRSAELAFQEFPDKDCCTCSAVLSHGAFLHVKQDFLRAKELYQNVIQEMSKNKDLHDPATIGACNMSPEEVLLAARCALGQLEVHLGNFEDARETMTKALTKAEEHFGLRHPKVGVILVAIALMYKHQASLDHSSSLLIQEGLYRRAIELLNSPPMMAETAQGRVDRRDIVALARGGYGDVLSVQENRKGEGERMKAWAESAWRHRRLTLVEALEFSNSSKAVVLDTRIGRAL